MSETKVLFCLVCGWEIDKHDVDANLTAWGLFKCVCSDCIEFVQENPNVLRGK